MIHMSEAMLMDAQSGRTLATAIKLHCAVEAEVRWDCRHIDWHACFFDHIEKGIQFGIGPSGIIVPHEKRYRRLTSCECCPDGIQPRAHVVASIAVRSRRAPLKRDCSIRAV